MQLVKMPIRPKSMNNAEITRVSNVISPAAFQRTSPAVAEVSPTRAETGDLSHETQSGLQRLAQLIQLEKTKLKKRPSKRQQAIEVYEFVQNFSRHGEPGQVVDRYT